VKTPNQSKIDDTQPMHKRCTTHAQRKQKGRRLFRALFVDTLLPLSETHYGFIG
jgi:hypothetical protein